VWEVVASAVDQDVSCTCRSEPARDEIEDAAGYQVSRVIVDDHREQARSYRKGGD